MSGHPLDAVVAARSLDEVLDLYSRWGEEHYDEDLSQLAHAEQVAAWAVLDGDDDAAIAAALLHDVGHLLVMAARDTGRPETELDLGHERLGARYLGRILPPAVTGPIALHVAAKRYRCGADPAEIAALSPGSQLSLRLQGGPLDADERARFDRLPSATAALALRRRDDAGKVPDADPAPFATHEALLRRVVAAADEPRS